MKRITIILVMLLMAATSFNQSSRRTTNSTKPAGAGDDISDNNRRYSGNKTYNKKNVKSDRSTVNTSVRRTSNGNSNYSYSKRNTNTVNNSTRRTVNVNKTSNNYASSRMYVKSRPVKHTYSYPIHSREYRAQIYPYRQPPGVNIFWTNSMRYKYYRLYPSIKWWYYPAGYRIPTISAYDALFYTGEVRNVYGKIYEVFYSGSSDEYFVYFGAYYPHHDFTAVIPGWIARSYSHSPERYFKREHMLVTGLITSFSGEPEIVVKSAGQIRIY